MKLSGENIICFAGEDWWYHNPHSNLHLMKAFAKNNRILFVNSIGVRMPDLKRDKFAWKKIINKCKSLLRYLKKAEKNIFVLSPVALPLIKKNGRLIGRLNKTLVLFQMKCVLKLLGFRNPIVWVCAPSFAEVALAIPHAKKLIYYCVDNIAFYTGEMDGAILNLEAALLARADTALFVNHQLAEERRGLNINIRHVEHGVDYDHYAQAQGGGVSPLAEMQHIKKPIVGYVGVVRGLDLSLIQYLAEKNPALSFVFIGDIQQDISPLKRFPNIHFLGKKPYEKLPQYMQAMDCYGIFYEMNDVFNRYRNPKKLLEYFATGKPVVSVPILELEYFREFVYIAHSAESFDRLLKDALTRDSAAASQERIRYAKEHTWDIISEICARAMF